jgi:hypothetical protein
MSTQAISKGIEFDICGMSMDKKTITEYNVDNEGCIWFNDPLPYLGNTIWRSKCGNYAAVFKGVDNLDQDEFINVPIVGELRSKDSELETLGTTIIAISGAFGKLICIKIWADPEYKLN